MTASASSGATPSALVLFAHGSRDPRWSDPVRAIEAEVRQLAPTVTVRCAYLELTPPDLTTVVRDLVRDGVHRIEVLPLFLGIGRHAREDLPLQIDALRAAHPGLALRLRPAIGEDPQVIELLARIAVDSAGSAG